MSLGTEVSSGSLMSGRLLVAWAMSVKAESGRMAVTTEVPLIRVRVTYKVEVEVEVVVVGSLMGKVSGS